MNEQLIRETHVGIDDHDLDETVLRLSDYLAAVDMVIKETFAHSVWVKAEIRNLSSKGGHYYFELAEKDDKGNVIASCRGTLWKFKAKQILAKFQRATGMPLERDLSVLIKVSARFHVQYGFALNISDIDPSYTLGDLARQYAAILERLNNEGLLNLNRVLPTPFDIEHVIVITPEKAAGLGDFRSDADRLAATGACEFHYHTATFQGNHASKEIRHAISKGMLTFKQTYDDMPDLIVIIRGGGAVGDLAYLNDYELAALVAEQPVPVWVGIGHERDKVILDEVAHTSFDTPSKVIAGISNHLGSLMQRTQSFVDTIKTLSQQQISLASLSSERYFNNIEHHSRQELQRWQHNNERYFNNIKQHAKFHLRAASTQAKSYLTTVEKHSHTQLNSTQYAVQRYYELTQSASHKLIEDTAKQLRHYQQLIFIQHPARQLSQGYALLKDSKGRYISSIDKVDKGDFVNIALRNGSLTSVVIDIEKNSKINLEKDTPNS